MLQFFRKHQRIFFMVISIVVILSFTFFGTYSAFFDNDGPPDREITKAVDGSSIKQREVEMLSFFLSHGSDDKALSQNAVLNLFNDNVIRKDFLMTGLAAMLAEHYAEDLKGDLTERLNKISRFKPYVHPKAPFVSANVTWQQYAPALSKHLSLLQTKRQVTPETFSLLCNLYLDQQDLPPEMLKRILHYQQSQFSWMGSDPRLTDGDFALFGFHSLEEWFGPKFMKLVAQFIINAAAIAEQKGYRVSNEEVRSDLLQNILKGARELSSKEDLSLEEVRPFYAQQLHALGLDEYSATQVWKKVMLFRRFFQDVGHSVLVDPLAFNQFASYSQETASIEAYELPPSLQINSFRDLLKFQLYLEAVSSPKQRFTALSLPTVFLSADEVEKKCPNLVQRRFLLEASSVKKDEIAQRVSLKETWNWELEEANWALLKKEFPLLAEKNSVSRQERFFLLESIDPKVRQEIDRFVRLQMVDSHPEWIEEAFTNAEVRTIDLSLRKKGGDFPFEGISDREAFAALLMSAPLKAEGTPVSDKLSKYSNDGNNFHRIAVLKRPSHKEVLTFEMAQQDDTLDELLDKKLEEAYPEVRKKDLAVFQQADGSWKPLKEVKDQIGARLYPDLLKAIENSSSIAQQSPSLDYYVQHRLDTYLAGIKKQIEKNKDDPAFVKVKDANQADTSNSLKDQWKLVKTTLHVKRSDETSFPKEELFTLPEGSWSKATTSKVAFYQLLGRKKNEEVPFKKISEGQKILSIDAQRHLMQKLLELIKEKKGIDITYEPIKPQEG